MKDLRRLLSRCSRASFPKKTLGIAPVVPFAVYRQMCLAAILFLFVYLVRSRCHRKDVSR